MRALLPLLLVAGCVELPAGGDDGVGGGGGKADGNGTCEDPMYGDGTCQIDLACGIPDIDCFQVPATDELAQTAGSTLGITTLPVTDPHFAAARIRVDKAWELYKGGVQLGKLADSRLSLVLVQDDTVNAFVMPTETAGVGLFAIFLNTGLLDAPGMTDDQFDGILFHELTHLAKLHVSVEVDERLRRYYTVSDDGPEALGSTQIQHQQIHDKMKEWAKLAELQDWFDDDALADIPYGGLMLGLEFQYFDKIKATTPACGAQVDAVEARPDLLKLRMFDQSLPIPADWTTGTRAALAALRTCVASDPLTFKQFREALPADWTTYLGTQLTADDAPFDDMRALDGVLALVHSRLAKMKVIEASLEVSTGRPFSAVRFYSQEEEADDVSARLTKLNMLSEVGVTGFLMAALAEEKPLCEAALAAGGPLAYGRILDDDHHADCWRIAHAKQVYDHTERAAQVHERAAEPWVPTRVRRAPIY